jgi:flagellar biosynthesis GTPase FlhF
MRLETFRGASLVRVFEDVREALGDDAMVVRTRVLREGRIHAVEVIAARAAEVDAFRDRLDPGGLELPAGAGWPRVIGIVGPSGSGKTAAAARLAAEDFAQVRTGILLLGAHRPGTAETIRALRADVEIEAAADGEGLEEALLRLCECAVVLVDTPPLAPRDGGAGDRWMALLRRAEPCEVHLALAAGLRTEVATVLREDYLAANPTHLLLTKLDEVPGGAGAAEIPLRMEMPARWVSDAPEGHGSLRAAVPRILDLLGVESAPERAAA